MDGFVATLLLLGAGFCVVLALATARWLRIDAKMERAASKAAWRAFGKGLAMAGWMMLATVGVVTVGVVPTTWLTSPAGAFWFAMTLLGSLAVIAWARSVTQAHAATSAKLVQSADQSQPRKAA